MGQFVETEVFVGFGFPLDSSLQIKKVNSTIQMLGENFPKTRKFLFLRQAILWSLPVWLLSGKRIRGHVLMDAMPRISWCTWTVIHAVSGFMDANALLLTNQMHRHCEKRIRLHFL